MRAVKRTKARRELAKDVLLIMFGILLAWLMAQSGIINSFTHIFGSTVATAFSAGIFFTSVFTVAPASVALSEIAQSGSINTVALWGALGAMFGDLILFYFIRDRFSYDVINSLKPSVMRHIMATFHFGFLKWLSPLIGALIIASPLPDEFGLTLLGMSRIKVAILMPVSFVMNALGIYIIIWFANAI